MIAPKMDQKAIILLSWFSSKSYEDTFQENPVCASLAQASRKGVPRGIAGTRNLDNLQLELVLHDSFWHRGPSIRTACKGGYILI